MCEKQTQSVNREDFIGAMQIYIFYACQNIQNVIVETYLYAYFQRISPFLCRSSKEDNFQFLIGTKYFWLLLSAMYLDSECRFSKFELE